jgi:hypothetical protein
MDITFFLQLYAEVASAAEAEQLSQKIMPQIEAYALVETQEVSQYWKIPEYYGINFSLHPGNEPNAAFDGLVSLSAKGWSFYGDSQHRDAVWNFEEDIVFLSPAVKWANLALWV